MQYSEQQIDQIIKLKKQGVSHRDISEHVFGKRSAASSVWYILNEKYYPKAEETKPKILIFDIETTPEIVYSWGRWKQNTGVRQVLQRSYMLCWAAKWLEDNGTYRDYLTFYKEYAEDPSNDFKIVKSIWDMLDSADVVVAHNGIKFDLAYLNSRFAYHQLGMPSPFKVVDTLKVAKKYFRFPANSLAELAEYLGVEDKKGKTDFDLWKGCMDGDVEAWETMVEYNVQDVQVLEQVYIRLRDYDKSHPNLGLYYSDDCIRDPVTGSVDVVENGFAYTAQSVFPAYKGPSGHTFRSSKRLRGVKFVNSQ